MCSDTALIFSLGEPVFSNTVAFTLVMRGNSLCQGLRAGLRRTVEYGGQRSGPMRLAQSQDTSQVLAAGQDVLRPTSQGKEDVWDVCDNKST